MALLDILNTESQNAINDGLHKTEKMHWIKDNISCGDSNKDTCNWIHDITVLHSYNTTEGTGHTDLTYSIPV